MLVRFFFQFATCNYQKGLFNYKSGKGNLFFYHKGTLLFIEVNS